MPSRLMRASASVIYARTPEVSASRSFRRSLTCAVGLGVSLSAFSSLLCAQDEAQGYNPADSYGESSFDSVDYGSGNLLVHIPIISYSQKGSLPPLSLYLALNSNVWTDAQIPCGGGGPTGVQANCPRWVLSSGNGILINRAGTLARTGYHGNTPDTTNPNYDHILDVSGGDHPLAATGASSFESIDGTGLQIGANGMLDRSGILHSGAAPYYQVVFGAGPMDGFGDATRDPNGNTITPTYTTVSSVTEVAGWQDSLGRTIPAPLLTDRVPGCVLYQYPVIGASGATAPIKFCYSAVTATSAFGDQYIKEQEFDRVFLTSMTLQNGQAWTFTYNSWGDLQTITLPTGATVTYQWTSQFFGGSVRNVPDGNGNERRILQSRTVDAKDGTGPHTWTYNYSFPFNSSTPNSTLVTDPSGNDSVYTLASSAGGRLEIHYQGPQQGGVVLETIQRGYTAAYGSASSSGTAIPFSTEADRGLLKNVVTTLSDGSTAEQVFSYDSGTPGYDQNQPDNTITLLYGNITGEADYDYGPNAPGKLLKQTNTTYLWQTHPNSYVPANLLDLVDTTSIGDGTNTQSTTSIKYDEDNGSPQGALGDPTSVLRSGVLEVSTVYNSAGMPVIVTDGRSNSTTLDYQCSGAFPFHKTNALGQVTIFTYDCNTGLLTSEQDANGKTTGYGYTPMRDLQEISYPAGGSTTTDYHGYSIPLVATSTETADPNPAVVTTTTFDGLGRRVTVQNATSSGSLTVMTNYDSLGRQSYVSTPYSGTKPAAGTSYHYDALGRKKLQTEPDNSAETWTYVGAGVTFQDGRGSNSKSFTDGLGRLKQVFEPDANNKTTIETDYNYDVANNLTLVLQAGSPARSRSFNYDSLSRLISASNPESGEVCYGLVQGNKCIPQYDGNGNLLTKTDARGVITNYTYDALNRVKSKQYTVSVNGVDATPASCFSYDHEYSSASGSSSVGRLVAEWTQPGACTSSSGQIPNTALNWKKILNYDAMGRIVSQAQCALAPCLTDIGTMNWTYDLAGNQTSSNNGAGTSGGFGIGLTSQYDSAGRLSLLQSTYNDDTHPGTLLSADPQVVGSPTYGPFGLTNEAIGIFSASQPGLLSRSRSYDSMGRVLDDAYTSSSVSPSSPTPPQTPGIIAKFEENPIAQGVTGMVDVGCDQTCGSGYGGWNVDGTLIGGFSYSPSNASTLGQVALPSNLQLGTHQFQVFYQDSTTQQTFTSSLMPFSVVANTLPQPTISARFENDPVPVGESGVLNITLSCTTTCGAAQGQFTVNGDFGGGFTLDENGTAVVYTPNSLPVGQYPVVISWNGNGSQSAAQKTVTLNVQSPPIPTGTTTAAVAPFIGNAQGDVVDLPQGEYGIVTIQNACNTDCGGGQYFIDGNFEGGFYLDNSGSTSVYIYPNFNGTSTPGTHQLTLAFAGNSSWGPYTSPAIPFTVTDSSSLPVPTITAVPLSSPVPAQTWSQVSVSLGPNAAACGGTGQVLVDGQYSDTFYVGSDGTVTGNTGQYALISPVSATTHTLAVSYWGTNSCASTSQSFSFTAQ